MAVTKNERTKAARLRARKTLKPEHRAWLVDYDKRKGPAKPPVKVARGVGSESTAESSPPGAGSAQPVPSPAPAAVHTTAPLDGALPPETFQWVPTVPPSPEGAEPPLPGAAPVAEGAPIVDAPPMAAPVGDTAAAAQFAALVTFIAGIGIQSALELAADAPLPPAVRALIEGEDAHKQVLEQVHGAAERVAIKWGFTSVPFADEAIVAVSVVGSVAAYVKVQQKRRTTQPTPKPQPQASEPREPRGMGDVDLSAPVRLPKVLDGVFGP